MSTNRIEKTIILRAPRERVWTAIADSQEFGSWFGMRLEGAFAPGARVNGRMTYPGYEHLTVEFLVDQVNPQDLFSYRWHPYAIEVGVDYSAEPMTLVEFKLSEVPGGTQLVVVESGFDQIPLARRAEAFRMDDEGWTEQVKNIERYVTA